MPDASTLALFAVAALTLIVIPGPAVLYIVSRSIEQGRAAGLVSVLGVAAGASVHVAAAALGLSSLLLSSALAFSIVKYAGAAYLVYLGVRTLLRKEQPFDAVPTNEHSLRRIFTQGAVVNILNPKTALFFFAFLPQFVDFDAGSVGLQIAILGGIFVLLALVSDSVWALAAGAAAERLRGSERFLRVRRYASGTVLVGLGVVAARSRG
jgi:threonine/homoserine/homoserine lactone efflux protein